MVGAGVDWASANLLGDGLTPLSTTPLATEAAASGATANCSIEDEAALIQRHDEAVSDVSAQLVCAATLVTPGAAAGGGRAGQQADGAHGSCTHEAWQCCCASAHCARVGCSSGSGGGGMAW